MAHLHNIYDSDIHFKLDSKTRTFSNETDLKLLVAQGDHNSERITFEIPRYIEQHDMLKCNRIEVHYINISSTTRDTSKDVYIVDDAQVSPEDENVVEFSWLLSGRATQYNGTLSFAVSMKCLTDEVIDYKWNTLTYEKILVGKSLNNAETIAQEYSDVLEKWKKEVLENINPTVTIDTELNEESDNAIANCTVAKKISQLSDEKANKTYVDEQIAKAQLEGAGVDTSQFVTQSDLKNINTGLTTAQVNALNEMFKVCAYTQSDVSTQYNAFKTAFGIGESGGEEPDTPITPTVTLSSITATYSGGEVLAGIDVDDLTGITVTGTYSDGSTKNIIDYTLSGAINEGSNTITVSYQGKTTTFTVVGYVEDEPIVPSEPTEPVYKLAQATTFDGTNHVDTGYILNDVDKDWSILLEYEVTTSKDNAKVFSASKNVNNFGPYLREDTGHIGIGNTGFKYPYKSTSNATKYVITHKKDSGVFNTYVIRNGVNFVCEESITYNEYSTNSHTIGNTLPLVLGKNAYDDSNYFNGTIHQFEIHERVITDEEIDTFIGATWEAPSEPTNLIDINTCTLGGSMPDGRQFSTDYYITDFIPIVSGNPYYTNITRFIDDSTSDHNQFYYLYNSSKQNKSVAKLDKNVAMGTNFDFTVINEEAIAYVRLVFHKNYKDIAFFSEGRL